MVIVHSVLSYPFQCPVLVIVDNLMCSPFLVGRLLICVVQEHLFIGYIGANCLHEVVTIERFKALVCLDVMIESELFRLTTYQL